MFYFLHYREEKGEAWSSLRVLFFLSCWLLAVFHVKKEYSFFQLSEESIYFQIRGLWEN